MIFHPRDALVGFVLYLAVCIVSLGAGNGLLKLLRVCLEDQLRFFFAPILTLVFWVLWLGLAGAVGWPLKYVCPCVWGATLVLFGYGCWGRPRIPLASLPGLLLCILLPALGMARAFAFGLTEYAPSLIIDGWNYIAFAQYHWEFGRNVVAGLPAFYDSGIHMMPTRYISSSLLALLSCLHEPGETITMGSLLQAFALYCTASAVLFFWLTQQRTAWFTCAAATVTILCGWVLRTVWIANYDNTVFLFFMPALAGVLAVMPPGNRAFRVLAGLVLAAGAYIYVECFVIGLAGVVVLTVPRSWRERAQWRTWLAAGTAATGLGVVLVLPVSRMLTDFFSYQLQVTTTLTRGRPGEGLAQDFFVPRRFPETFWAFSGYCATPAADKYKQLCATGLTALFGLGLCQLLRERRWGLLLCLGFLGAGVLYMIFGARYDYGIYKLLNLGWWCLAATLVGGVEWLIKLGRGEAFRPVALSALALCAAIYAYIARVRQPAVGWLYASAGLVAGLEWLVCLRSSKAFPALVVSALLPLGAGYAYLSRIDFLSDRNSVIAQRLSDLRQTEAIRRIVGTEPVLDASDDGLNCLVSRYNLRNLNACPLLHRGIILYLGPTGRPCSPDTRFLITDTFTALNVHLEQVARRVQVLGTYTLWELDHHRPGREATVVAIDNLNGLENHDNVVHFWLGPGRTVVHVLAAKDGELHVDCSFVAGPCGPDRPLRTMKLSTTAGFTEQHTLGALGLERKLLCIPVRAGLNQIGLEALDEPVHVHASAADSRTLLLFVKLHSTRFVSAAESASPCRSIIECPRRPGAP